MPLKTVQDLLTKQRLVEEMVNKQNVFSHAASLHTYSEFIPLFTLQYPSDAALKFPTLLPLICPVFKCHNL